MYKIWKDLKVLFPAGDKLEELHALFQFKIETYGTHVNNRYTYICENKNSSGAFSYQHLLMILNFLSTDANIIMPAQSTHMYRPTCCKTYFLSLSAHAQYIL